MYNDIFVDNNIAKNFCNPLDPEYKTFITWLFREGCLAVSNKILSEYHSSFSHSSSKTNIIVIINRLLIDGRLNKISNEVLKSFVFRKHVLKQLRANRKDYNHIKVVLLSDRKLALSLDKNFRNDVNNFPGYCAIAGNKPSEIPYN